MDERLAYVCFGAFPGIGPLRFKSLLAVFRTAAKAWLASPDQLRQSGLGPIVIQKLIEFRQTFDPDVYTKQLSQQEIRIVTRLDNEYPALLKEIPDPPIALFIKGSLPEDYSHAIAIVGTRKPTPYGREITEKLVEELTLAGCTIVSGLARGVDAIAHRTTLTNKGITIAVLGCGVDIVYPPEHKELYAQIIQNGGAVISEAVPGHTVIKGLFPQRNRIISGLSRGVVVTEGAKDSGSLITARFAAEQGRDVFAVPGPVTSYLSAGPVKLIQDGARVVTRAQDILDELGINGRQVRSGAVDGNRSETENKILTILQNGACHIDDIVRGSGLEPQTAAATLSILELSGIIQNLGDGMFCRKKS